jgi:presenilin-like A22 family membrane protease
MQVLNTKNQSSEARGNSDLKGLTSKQHLFARVILVVTLANAAIFYNIFRNLQALTVTWQFTEVAVLATAITLFVLTVNLEFWWRYQRK